MHPALTRFARRSRLAQVGIAAAVVVALLLWWQPTGGVPEPSGRVTFTTGVRTGVYERYAQLLRNSLRNDLPEVDVELKPSEGSVQNIRRLVSGKAQFSLATADAVADHLDRGAPGAARLRACARLYDDYAQLVVPDDSPVQHASDLRGKRVAIGQPGSGVSLMAQRLLTAADVDPKTDIEPVPVGIDRMPELLRQGKIDAFFWSGGLPTGAVSELAGTTDVRLVPLGDLTRALQAQGASTRHYREAVMPADAYPSIQDGKPVRTVAVANLLVTTDRVDPVLAERVTRTVLGSRDRIGRKVHAAQLVDLRTAIYTDPLELHEGARRYYRSMKS